MPVIEIQTPVTAPPPGMLALMAKQVQSLLDLPDDRVWILWTALDEGCYFRPSWGAEVGQGGPIVRIRCKSDYNSHQVNAVMTAVAEMLAEHMCVPLDSVYVVVDPVVRGRLFVRGQRWK